MGSQYNWAEVFAGYCNNASFEELSELHGIALDSLKERARCEGWKRVRNHLLAQNRALARLDEGDNSTLAARTERRLNKLRLNREQNFRDVGVLIEHAREVIEKLRDGTLELEKVFNGKDGIRRATVKPGPGDWVNIATYLRTLQDLSYRALGDMTAAGKAEADVPAGNNGNGNAPAITIILPAAIALPRSQREQAEAGRQAAQVVDLKDVKVIESKSEEPATDAQAPGPDIQAEPDSEPPAP